MSFRLEHLYAQMNAHTENLIMIERLLIDLLF